MNSRTPKIISGIIATISCISLAFFFLTEFWFWVSFELSAAAIVTIGCGGEWWLHHHPAGRKKKERDLHHSIESKFIGMVVIGLIMEFASLGHSIREGYKLEEKVSAANERTANTESNNAVLTGKVIELAHQYDLSTNALAEANVRLAAIKPAKQRFVEILNALNPEMIKSLKTGQDAVFKGFVSQVVYDELWKLSQDESVSKFISFVPFNGFMATFSGNVSELNIQISHKILQ